MSTTPNEIPKHLSGLEFMEVEAHLTKIKNELTNVLAAATVADILEFNFNEQTLHGPTSDSEFSRRNVMAMLQLSIQKSLHECRTALVVLSDAASDYPDPLED